MDIIYKGLQEKLPIFSNRLKLNLICEEDLGWFTRESLSARLNEFEAVKLYNIVSEEGFKQAMTLEIQKSIEDTTGKNCVLLAIKDIRTEKVLGHIDLKIEEPERPAARIGYWLMPSAEHKGYMSEALEELIRTLGELGIHSAVISVHSDNTKSLKLAYKLNFHRTSTKEEESSNHKMITLTRNLKH